MNVSLPLRLTLAVFQNGRLVWRRRNRTIDDAERVVKDVDRSRERTMNRAVKLLAAKPRSEGELRERLLEKLWTDASIVDAVITKLKEYSYLDDEQYARDLAVSRLRRRPQGRRSLQQTLSQKKLPAETVTAAIAAAYDKLPESELIDVAIEKRLRLRGHPKTRDDKRRLYDHLLRRGFDLGLINEKLRDLEPIGDREHSS